MRGYQRRCAGAAIGCLFFWAGGVLGTELTTGETAAPEAPVSILVGEGDQVQELVVDLDEPDPVKAFGMRTSAPITGSVVVIGDRCLPAPHTVTRRGLEILVNDVLAVPATASWPLPAVVARVLDREPVAPEGPVSERQEDGRLLLNNTWNDYLFDLFKWKKKTYADQPEGEERARNEIIIMVRSLPGVDKAEVWRGHLQVTLTGDPRPSNYSIFGMLGHFYCPPTVRDLANNATAAFTDLVDQLDFGMFLRVRVTPLPEGHPPLHETLDYSWQEVQGLFTAPEDGWERRLLDLGLLEEVPEIFDGKPITPHLREGMLRQARESQEDLRRLRRVVLDPASLETIARGAAQERSRAGGRED
jgi:hypothetical protein